MVAVDVSGLLEKLEGFDWDKGNQRKSQEKHGVTDKETEEVFFNRPLFVEVDKKHSLSETRFKVLGKTNTNRYLFLVYTIRKNKIRIISARDQNRKERKTYDQV